MMMQAAGFW